jgi:3-oxoacyl-[acyl-carrier-protein] synthase II
VTLVQAALTRSTGPCFAVSAGCSSTAVQLGNAALMIASGAIDLAVVTGVDLISPQISRIAEDTLQLVRATGGLDPSWGIRAMPNSFELPMRPYDRRPGSMHIGEGAATLIVESREHADRRGARRYGQLLSHAIARDGLPHPLVGDGRGIGLAAAIRRCLGDRWRPEQVRYVHGAGDGSEQSTADEARAIRAVWGPDTDGLLLTSQEACFGHSGAPLGCVGVVLTLLPAKFVWTHPNLAALAEGLAGRMDLDLDAG